MIDYANELNAAQYEAVETTEGPVLVLAGAGSGKTRTLIYRVCRLLEKGVKPGSILLLTFTNKAAKEMKERAEAMIGKTAGQVMACTYHSFCTRMLRRYSYQAGLLREFTVLSGTDPEVIMDMISAELGYTQLTNFPKGRVIARIASDAVNRALPIDMIIRSSRSLMESGGFFSEIKSVCREAESYKRRNNLLTYDDLMLRFSELLDEHPDIAEEIDREFQYICVDEYQDTNPLQGDILKKIRKVNRNLMVVGDDYQSIYGFRGSDIRIIQSFPEEYPGSKVIFLNQNYRSTPEIVDLSNKVMHTNAVEDRFKKSLESGASPGPKPILVFTKNQETAAKSVATNIIKAHANGRAYKDTLILARNSASFAPIETVLTALRIPYEKRGGVKFFDLSHVQALLAFIRVICNPRDELSWFRILTLLPGIGDATARQIAGGLRENSLDELLKHEGKKYEAGLKRLYQELTDLYSCESVQDLVKEAISFYKEQKSSVEKKTPEEVRAAIERTNKEVRDLEVIEMLAANYVFPTDLLDTLSFDVASGTDEGNSTEDRVVLSTVHSAKGLEFDSVYILDCVDGIFPSTDIQRVGDSEDQEELRCFYVAVTRAKRLLFLFAPQFCRTRRGVQKKYPSHSLQAVPDTVQCIRQGTPATQPENVATPGSGTRPESA